MINILLWVLKAAFNWKFELLVFDFQIKHGIKRKYDFSDAPPKPSLFATSF